MGVTGEFAETVALGEGVVEAGFGEGFAGLEKERYGIRGGKGEVNGRGIYGGSSRFAAGGENEGFSGAVEVLYFADMQGVVGFPAAVQPEQQFFAFPFISDNMDFSDDLMAQWGS